MVLQVMIHKRKCGGLNHDSLLLSPCRKAKAIEFMMVDALLEADTVLRLTDKIWDVNQFVQLDDGVLEVGGNELHGKQGEQQPWQASYAQRRE